MWTCGELKARGKAAFRKNYWRCVLIALILGILTGGTVGSVGTNRTQEFSRRLSDFHLTTQEAYAVIAAIAAGGLIVIVAAVLIEIFIRNPLTVGGYRFFVRNSREEMPGAGLLFSAYRDGRFGRVFATMFLKDLFLALWTILFIIPGIIKYYSYRMVPYLLADHPEMSATEVITTSREMMNGHKWHAFVLDLSFILWYLLTVITLGLAGIFYVFPYVQATNAELYRTLAYQN